VLGLIDLSMRVERSINPARTNALAQSSRDIAAIFAQGGYPVDVEPVLGLIQRPDSWQEQLDYELDQALVGFAVADERDVPLPAPPKGFFEPDAFTNKAHVLFALRTTAAALFCYILYALLDWPGIHTCFLTCYIVSLGTAAESVEKLMLRIIGCLAGAALGYVALLFIMPSITSVVGLMLVVFLGTAIAAWVVAGGPFVAYVGFQLAFAFLLCVIQGAAPSFDLTVARDRVIGILLGNFVSYVALTRLWPSSIVARIDQVLARAVDLLALSARRPAMAAAAAGAIGSSIGAVARDIELAAYEPEGLGKGDAWRLTRWRLAEAIGAVTAPLLLASRTSMADLDAVGGELEGLAQQIRLEAPIGIVSSEPALQPLRAAIAGLRHEVEGGLYPKGDARAAA